MKGGQRPKPTELQILEGDPRRKGKRKLEQKLAAEPKPQSGLTECPEELTGRARKVWHLWAEELEVMRLSKRPDSAALEGACRAYERAVEADLILQAEGLLVKDVHVNRDGSEVHRIRKHPAVDISTAAWAAVRHFCTEFGFTPAARTRLTVEHSNDQTDIIDLLAGKQRKSNISKVLDNAIQPASC